MRQRKKSLLGCSSDFSRNASSVIEQTNERKNTEMTAKIIWIVVGALAMVGAMIWIGKAVEAKEEAPEEKK